MCMRCHMGTLNPPGLVMKLKSDKSAIKGGDTITFTTTLSGFSKNWRPGIALMTDRYSEYASHTPQEYGWEIVNNSNDNQFNFFKIQNNDDSVFYWKLVAPQYPGTYRFAVSGFFSDLTTGKQVQGTKRGDNSLVITVTKSDFQLEQNQSKAQSAYRNFFFFSFPIPVDSSRVMAHLTGTIRKLIDTTSLKISNIWQTRDNKTVIIKTSEPMYRESDYSWMYINLKVYSLTQKSYNGNVIATNNPEPYRIYAEFSQDVTKTEIKQQDRTEYLGYNNDEVHRLNLGFFLPANPIDLLPVEKITKATLCLTPKYISVPSQKPEVWTVTKLIPNTNWYDYFGNNQTVETNWSGYNPVKTPISELVHNIPADVDTSADGKWKWDITKDFIERFKKLGGSGTNSNDYFLRLQALDETNLSGGIGFYGTDADSMDNMPYIELDLDITKPSRVDEVSDINFVHIFPNPVTDILHISGDYSGQQVRIYSPEGFKVYEAEFKNEIGLSKLPVGIYFMRVRDKIAKFSKF